MYHRSLIRLCKNCFKGCLTLLSFLASARLSFILAGLSTFVACSRSWRRSGNAHNLLIVARFTTTGTHYAVLDKLFALSCSSTSIWINAATDWGRPGFFWTFTHPFPAHWSCVAVWSVFHLVDLYSYWVLLTFWGDLFFPTKAPCTTCQAYLRVPRAISSNSPYRYIYSAIWYN
jgi:hypothetical protein